MKGEILADHIPLNKFELRVAGLVAITALTISGLEEELDVTELPDRTVASSGEKKPSEFELAVPMHHTVEFLGMEAWYKEGQDPILPTYKKPCTLIHKSVGGTNNRTFTLLGVFVKARKLPDLDKANEGELAMVTYTMSVDEIIPL